MKKVIVLSTAIFAMSCSNVEKAEPTQKEEITVEETMLKNESLKTQLDAKKAAFNAKASEEKKTIYADGISTVANSGVLSNALNVGDIAPNFTLTNAKGEEVTLQDYLAKGPVVLTWYRGGWCPYCNLTLNSLQEALPQFKAEGASLLALTPEQPDKSMTTKEKNELAFEILSDVGNNVAREYGIVYKLTDGVAEIYQDGFDLHGYNGDESNELPLAATYIIDQTGLIQYAFLDAEYRNRAEPSEIITTLQDLQ